MPRKFKKLVTDQNLGSDDDSQEEVKEEDLSDDEEGKRRRRMRRKLGPQKPKIIDDTYLPNSLRKWRACNFCKLLLNHDKWNKIETCPNCPESRGTDDTTDNFESMISLILPKKSWVAEWQQIRDLIPGMYAMAVKKHE